MDVRVDMNSRRDNHWSLWLMLAAASDAVVEDDTQARMTDAYRGESLSFEDDGSPEHDY